MRTPFGEKVIEMIQAQTLSDVECLLGSTGVNLNRRCQKFRQHLSQKCINMSKKSYIYHIVEYWFTKTQARV